MLPEASLATLAELVRTVTVPSSLAATEFRPRSPAVSDWSATSEEATDAVPRSWLVSASGATSGDSTAFSAISSLPTASGAILLR